MAKSKKSSGVQRFQFVQDDSCHWYAIPAGQKKQFEEWVRIMDCRLFDNEFQGPGIDGQATWKPGMAEKQWFDATLKCGDLPRDYDSWGSRAAMAMGLCGASDWRAIKLNLMAPWKRALQLCNVRNADSGRS